MDEVGEESSYKCYTDITTSLCYRYNDMSRTTTVDKWPLSDTNVHYFSWCVLQTITYVHYSLSVFVYWNACMLY